MPADRARARNRLRNIYDQENRRQSRLAESRNQNRGNRSNRGAKANSTRVVVSERRTRREGFGRGGVQVTGRRGTRRNENNNNNNRSGGRSKRRFADRFADKSIVRSGASSRFDKGDRKNKNTSRRVTRGRDGRKKVVQQKNKQGGRRFRERKNEQKKRNGNNNNNNNKRGNNNNRNNNKKDLSAADLDAQLTAYTTGQSVSQVKKNQNKKVVTQADLDAQLDAFQAATNGNTEGGITL